MVLVRQEVVAQDIALTLLDRYGSAPVQMPQNLEEALACVAGAARVHAAVLELGPEDVEGSEIEREILSRGGRIVLFGKRAEASDGKCRWPVLQRPFLDAMLMNLLEATEPAVTPDR